jgi:hypothetical protein
LSHEPNALGPPKLTLDASIPGWRLEAANHVGDASRHVDRRSVLEMWGHDLDANRQPCRCLPDGRDDDRQMCHPNCL